MTDLHNTEVPVTSIPSISKPTGIVGKFWWNPIIRKTYAKSPGAAKFMAVSGIVTIVMSIVLVILVVAISTVLHPNAYKSDPEFNSNVQTPHSSEPLASQPTSVDTSNSVIINGIPRELPLQMPVATEAPELMAKKLAQLRYQAFCTGGIKGIKMLDQVWASHDEPKILPYTLENANNLDLLAPKAALFTYAADVHTFDAASTFTGSSCSYAFPGSLMTVPVSYASGNNQRVVVSIFKDGTHIVGAYTAVYVLIADHWFIDQVH